MTLIIIQVIAAVLLSVFCRTCLVFSGEYDNTHRFPRIVCVFLVALSFIPVVGLTTEILSLIFLLIGALRGGYMELLDNRFTRFWIKE
jgi:hypothetical protein